LRIADVVLDELMAQQRFVEGKRLSTGVTQVTCHFSSFPRESFVLTLLV